MDLQPGKYCIVPCIANLEGKDSRFLLRVLVEPHGFLKSWKKFEVTQNCTNVQPNGTCSSDSKVIAKPKLENSICSFFCIFCICLFQGLWCGPVTLSDTWTGPQFTKLPEI